MNSRASAVAICQNPCFAVHEETRTMLIPQQDGSRLLVDIGDFIVAAMVVAQRTSCPSCGKGIIAGLDVTAVPLKVRCGTCERRFLVHDPEETEEIIPVLIPL